VLNCCNPFFPFHTAEFLDHFRQQFIAEVDASTIVLELEHRGIISDGDQKTIRQEVKATLQAQLLHACLKKTCDAKALTDVCDIIATVKGNPRMKSFGEHMKTEWEKGVLVIRRHYLCVLFEVSPLDCALLLSFTEAQQTRSSHWSSIRGQLVDGCVVCAYGGVGWVCCAYIHQRVVCG